MIGSRRILRPRHPPEGCCLRGIRRGRDEAGLDSIRMRMSEILLVPHSTERGDGFKIRKRGSHPETRQMAAPATVTRFPRMKFLQPLHDRHPPFTNYR